MTVHVVAYDTADPGDTTELEKALARFPAERIRTLAILAKTEGNSEVNDFSRQYGLLAAKLALEKHGGSALRESAALLFSTGVEGAMTPFGYLIVDEDDGAAPTQPSALAISVARSRPIQHGEVGTPAQTDLVTETVAAAVANAGVGVDDVALVIVKTPVMSHQPAEDPEAEPRRITSGFSKAVASLGAGVALGEVDRARIVPEAFDKDHSLHARRVISFSGSETDRIEVLLLANAKGAPGSLAIHTGFMEDLLDARAVRRTLESAGLALEDATVLDPERVKGVIAKVGLAPNGRLRGARTTMRTSHLDMDKHLRATMSGIIGSTLGTTRAFISANTVHQAPPGGGICAFIVDHSSASR